MDQLHSVESVGPLTLVTRLQGMVEGGMYTFVREWKPVTRAIEEECNNEALKT